MVFSMTRSEGLALVLALSLCGWNGAAAQSVNGGVGHGMHGHGGVGGGGHDMATMPGLRGLDATPEESAELATMFRNFRSIERRVTDLPDGIRAETWSRDPALRDVIVSHTVGMVQRLEEGRDPKVFIQSPTLDILFAGRDRIVTVIETTETGIVVTQTSDDPDIVAALRTHADEVTDMAARGMQAVHEAMMRRAAN